MRLSAVLLTLAPFWTAFGQSYTISTFAGGGLPVNIAGTSAPFASPQSVAVDKTGNVFFIDYNSVFRLDAITGVLSLAAGDGIVGFYGSGDNGPATGAALNFTFGGNGSVAVDSAGNLYIADSFESRVRKVSNGVITTVAGTGTYGFSGDGGPATSAELSNANAVAVDSAGNLYIADFQNDRIREVSNGVITTVAGNGTTGFSGDGGPATSAALSLTNYVGIAVDSSGNLYFADNGNNRIRKVSNGVITTVAGNGVNGFTGDNGPATSAEVGFANGVAVDSNGNLFISDGVSIRKVSNGVITTVAGIGAGSFSGDNGPATSAGVAPTGIAVDSVGNLYIADSGNGRIRKVSNGAITTIAGNGAAGPPGNNGPATSATLDEPTAVAVDATGSVYIAGTLSYSSIVQKVSNGVITTVAGGGTSADDGVPATSATLGFVYGIAVDSAGNLYIADYGTGRVRRVSNGVITTVAGNGTAGFSGDNGPATSAQLYQPWGVAVDAAGNVYVSDYGNNRVRKVSNGMITTVAGNGTAGFSGDNGPATGAELNQPAGIAVDSAGNLYIADNLNSRIRKVSKGMISTAAGPDLGPNGGGGNWQGVAVDSADNLYITVLGFFQCVLRASGGVVTTIAGNLTLGFTYGFGGDGGPATSAQISVPGGVAVDADGKVYFADVNNNRIRLLTPPPLSVASPSSIPAGAVGVTYSGATFSGSGGTGIYTWSAAGLPNGLSLSASGVVGGAPTLAGAYNPQFTVTDSTGKTAGVTLSLTIYPASSPVISSLSPNSTVPAGPAFTLTVNGSGFVSGATVQWNGSALPTTFVSVTQLTASVAASLIASAGSASIVVVNPGGVSSSAAVFSIPAPAVNASGVVPLYSPVPVVQPGSWVSIFGTSMANGVFSWNGDFPTTLGGVSVTIDSKPAYLWYVSPTLINLQVPDDTNTGPVNVVITSATGTATSTVTLAPYGPSFLVQADGKHILAVVPTPGAPGNSGLGYDVIGSSRPVQVGETMLLFGIGFGPTTPAVPAGQAFSGAAPTATPVTVAIGGVQANVAFAGIIEAGLYQINATVLPNTGSGDQPTQATINGVETPAGPVIAVQ